LFLLGAICLTLGLGGASAAQLTWDPLNNGGNPPADGNWDTTAANMVWAPGNVAWTQTSTTAALNGAIFGGVDGTWAINIDAGQVAVNNLTINSSGYTFSGSPIYLASTDFLTVADGKTVTFNCNLTGANNGAQYWPIGSGSTVNVVGNIGPGTTQVRLAGPANSAFYLSGANNTPSIVYVLAPVYLTNGTLAPSSSCFIGYQQTLPAPNSTTYAAGTLSVGTVDNPATLTVNGQVLFVGRAAGTGTLNLTNGAVNVGIGSTARNLAICYDAYAGESGTVNVNGGTLTVGSATTPSQIAFFNTTSTGPPTGSTAVMTQTAGTVNAWGGIVFGLASGPLAGGSAALTESGGILYVGSVGAVGGISLGASSPSPSVNITLSGGTVGALANWSSSLPMTLGTANGNITFQCADSLGTPHNISLSGALTGAGGLYVTGGGTLTLSGANNIAGSTVVSNGTLAIITSSSPMTNGPVTLDASAGSPAVTVTVSNPGQYWTNNGALTFINAISGVPAVNFQLGALSPSTSVAPIQVSGNVAFTATPIVNVGGAAIAVGSYPLIKYTGAVSGTMPTTVTTWTGGTASAGYLTNITATKTIALVVTSSTYNPALYWRVGNGVWDINTTANWTQFSSPVKYTDGNAVIFDDTATGPSPMIVTLDTIVNPLSVTTDNAAPTNYTISGTGAIAGAASVTLLGSGALTLSGTNTYTGGTIISAGQLNINNGGDAINGTAIGLGPLTINAGATIDNTSGSNVTLQASIPGTWNGNFTYLGSANNFNTGPGLVTMNTSITISNGAGNFTVGGILSDFGNNYQLSKTGNGTLTLPVANNFGGGLTLYSGQLNLGDPGAAGSGVFTINGGAIDNSSGADLTLNLPPAAYNWAGSFSFLGSTNLDLNYPTVSIPNGLGNITVNVVSNTLTTQGVIVNNNTRVIKSGNGIWEIAGAASSAESLGLLVSAGQVNLHKTSGQAIQGGNNAGLTVQANALVLDENSYQIHSGSAIPMPVVLSGGVWDLNGWNENVDQLSISSGGTLRNGASASTSILTTISGYTAMLNGPNCQFDVTAADGILNFNGALGGVGSLVKTGAGVLNLNSNNTYTGNTTVSGGTLALSYPSLASSSTVTVATNAILRLDFAATNTVGALVLNGVSQPAGLYNAASAPVYLAGAGSLLVGPSIPTAPTNITFSVSANTFFLSWPSNYVGWILQTNVVSLGASGNWHDVPGSETNTQLAVPLTNPAISNEFFRLRYP
jgi:autotransporter-associated beta strand protein